LTTRALQHRARKRFGQHFLEPAWVDRLIAAVDPRPDDDFVEIGPGRGAVTRPLSARARRVVAFEIDRDLAAGLMRDAPPNLTVVSDDFLDTTTDVIRTLLPDGMRVVGNLPYNVASPILFHLVDWFATGLAMSDATIMVQREVADRLAAPPGSRDYGVLTVLIGQWAEVTKRFTLPPGAFRPPPKVHSAVVRLRFRRSGYQPADAAAFATVVQGVFTRRRKTMANALLAVEPLDRESAATFLQQAGIDPSRRPETLDRTEFVRLSDAVAPHLKKARSSSD
jgi:16S rRNA (adenine1518-N6/adenine1519-N6)-dimethyltransferase